MRVITLFVLLLLFVPKYCLFAVELARIVVLPLIELMLILLKLYIGANKIKQIKIKIKLINK